MYKYFEMQNIWTYFPFYRKP